jgi:outer membrane biogenesis lipoprotein LolB
VGARGPQAKQMRDWVRDLRDPATASRLETEAYLRAAKSERDKAELIAELLAALRKKEGV